VADAGVVQQGFLHVGQAGYVRGWIKGKGWFIRVKTQPSAPRKHCAAGNLGREIWTARPGIVVQDTKELVVIYRPTGTLDKEEKP